MRGKGYGVSQASAAGASRTPRGRRPCPATPSRMSSHPPPKRPAHKPAHGGGRPSPRAAQPVNRASSAVSSTWPSSSAASAPCPLRREPGGAPTVPRPSGCASRRGFRRRCAGGAESWAPGTARASGTAPEPGGAPAAARAGAARTPPVARRTPPAVRTGATARALTPPAGPALSQGHPDDRPSGHRTGRRARRGRRPVTEGGCLHRAEQALLDDRHDQTPLPVVDAAAGQPPAARRDR